MIWATIILAAIGVGAAIIQGEAQKKVQKTAAKLEEYASKNQEWRDKVIEAYNEKSSAKLNSLLYQSPISNAYKHLQKEIAQDKEQYQKDMGTIKENEKTINVANSELINSQGPASGLIAGEIYNIISSSGLKKKVENLQLVDPTSGK